MSDQSLLTGCGAVVSGGSRGIGRAVTELLCNLGAGTASGGQATPVVGAADDERIATALIEECTSTFGRIDILINCAGIAEPPGSSILDISPHAFDRLIGVHLGTAFHTCRIAARVMAAQGQGSIINTSSAAFLGDYGGTGYPAGKGAVNGLTMAMAAELKGYGVRANVVCPGRQDTDFHRRGVRRAHRGPAPPWIARRNDHAGSPGRSSRLICGPDLRVSRQRLGVRRDGSDLCCGRWIRRPLRPANAVGVGVSRSPRRRTVVGCGPGQDDQRGGNQTIGRKSARSAAYAIAITVAPAGLIRIVESDLDGPIELAASLNRFTRAYVSKRVTSASLVSSYPPAEPLTVGGRMEDRDRGVPSSHMSRLPTPFSCAVGYSDTAAKRAAS
jgi:NAD(P)-dependent dehydrogenase (short-subunit alcohol dehydrogenase family)